MNNSVAPPASAKGAIILGGAHGSLEIARSLGRRGVPVWLITGGHPLASLSRYVERSTSWPGPCDESALDFLLGFARRHHLHDWVLFTGSDEDLRFVAQNHAALAPVFRLTTQSWDKVRWTYDKRLMNTRAAELGIAHPHTLYPATRDDLIDFDFPFPVIVKPTYRNGSNVFVDAKSWRADDERTLLALYDKARLLVGADRIMIQELVPGDGTTQFSYAAVWDRGRPVASLMARRRRQYPIEFGFTSTFVETIKSPEIEALAARFLESLGFDGLVEVEFKFDARDARYKILDVNARTWTWIALGAAAGVDFPAIQWRLASGENIVPVTSRSGLTWRYLSRDLVAAGHEMLIGRLSPNACLASMRRSAATAVFAWDDLWPAALDLPLSVARAARRRISRRNGGGAALLQSAKLRT